MHSEFDTKLDEALALLLEGAPLSTLTEKYPEYVNELKDYQALLSSMSEVAGAVPSEDGLRSALAQTGSFGVKAEPVQSPYLAYFMTYRNVLVLPVLLVVLIGGGVLVYPNYKAGETGSEVAPTEALSDGPLVASDASGATGPANQMVMQKTSAPEARTMMASEPQVDPALQEIFAYSTVGSESRSAQEEAAAKEALNDINGAQSFSNTYDNTF